MAGAGSRFAQAGYENPKPFIDVAGKPMIVRVLENLQYPNANYILIARREHIEKENQLVKTILEKYKTTIIPIEKLTEGTASTILYSRNLVRNNTPLVIANSDQIVDFDFEQYVNNAIERKLDGSILTFTDLEKNPKWSFVKSNSNGDVTEVREKRAISNEATVGIYLFSRGEDFVEGAVQMIIENDRVNNEYYTCPVYNYLIRENKKIGTYKIKSDEMHGLGTPEDLEHYISRYLR